MKSIFLHAGLHKTGTTSVQWLARKNHDVLKSLGVHYPPMGAKYGSVQGGLHSIPKIIEQRVRKGREGERRGSLEDLLDEFERGGLPALFISSEGFSRFKDKELAYLSEKLNGYDVVPITVYRHPISYRISFFCSRGGFDKTDVRKHFTRGRLNFGSRAEAWRKYFPKSVFLKYEDYENIAAPIFDIVTRGHTDKLAKDQRRRQSLSVDLAMLNSELRALFQVAKKDYEAYVYNHLFALQESAEYRAFRPDLSQKLLPIRPREQRKILDSLRDDIAKLSALMGKSCDDYLVPLSGHVVKPRELRKLKAMFVRLVFQRAAEPEL